MLKSFVLGCALSFVLVATASAQAGAPSDSSPAASSATGGAGARGGNITSTGETVPNPGASQSGGTTSMDRGIQQQDNKIESGICKGC